MKFTKKDVERNVRNVECGKPLDLPLRVLNGELKKRFFVRNRTDKEKAHINAYMREYKKTDKHKAYSKEYYQKNKELIKQRRLMRSST